MPPGLTNLRSFLLLMGVDRSDGQSVIAPSVANDNATTVHDLFGNTNVHPRRQLALLRLQYHVLKAQIAHNDPTAECEEED